MDSINQYLKDVVLNVKTPHIIKNLKLPWTCFNSTFENWCSLFNKAQQPGEELPVDGIEFETGSRKHSDFPQWEKFRTRKQMTVEDFLKNATEEDEFFKSNWAAYSYRNIDEMPPRCAEGIGFSYFGFPEVKEDITFWLSSTGAHTPCHYDTYGCNIVVQVFGRKMWLLFPPDAKLTPVRIPYEESSVYCSETFYSPKNLTCYKNFEKNCYKCILEPGDVLIVPAKWWHYVENLSPSLSVNAWIPLKNDVDTQIEECIVKILMENFIQQENDSEFLNILNPNEVDLWSDQFNLFDILKHLVQQKFEPKNLTKHPYCYMQDDELVKLISQFKEDIIPVPNISNVEFQMILRERFNRFDSSISNDFESISNNYVKHLLINTICSPNIVSIIKEQFLQSYHK